MDTYNTLSVMFEEVQNKISILDTEWSSTQTKDAIALLDDFVEIRKMIEDLLLSTHHASNETASFIMYYITLWEQFQTIIESQISRWLRSVQSTSSEVDSLIFKYNALMWADRLSHDLIEQLNFWDRCITGNYSFSLRLTNKIAKSVVQLLESHRRLGYTYSNGGKLGLIGS